MNNVKTIRPRTLPAAYRYAQMGKTCPNCEAPPGDWCQRPDGHHRRVPCLKRIPRRPQIDAEPRTRPGRCDDTARHVARAVASDFSEPRHQGV
jgi:hypothetical protein